MSLVSFDMTTITWSAAPAIRGVQQRIFRFTRPRHEGKDGQRGTTEQSGNLIIMCF